MLGLHRDVCLLPVCAQLQRLHDQYVAEVERLKKLKDVELREHRD
jgi:hypothetical protein